MSDHGTKPDPYQFLDRISTAELQRILREDFESNDEGTAENDEFITRVMEVIEKREKNDPTVPAFDPAAGWEDFQKNYRPTGEDPILLCDAGQLERLTQRHRVGKRVHRGPAAARSRSIRRIALVAAAIGVFMSLLVAAQAIGLDVFGAMARWTDETFRFVTTQTTNEVEGFCSALEEHGIPRSYAPTWLPDGFEADEPQADISKVRTMVSNHFSDGKRDILIVVTRYASKSDIDPVRYEKKTGEAIPHMNGQQLFYIFENADSISASYYDGDRLTIDICGQISIGDMKAIIDSIGGSL